MPENCSPTHKKHNTATMKTTRLLTPIFILSLLCYFASAGAQTPQALKAAQSIFTLTTFNADGSIHASTHGVFTGNRGEAVAPWHVFEGATRAVAIDAKGQQHNVNTMLGASDIYDVCRFTVDGQGRLPEGIPMATAPVQDSPMFLVEYSLKKPAAKKIATVRVEKFMTSYNYYVFNDQDVSSTDLGCPVVNAAGQLLGVMQRPEEGGQAFSADARITTTFTLNGLSINDPTLKATGIRTALPADEKQATLMLMLATAQNDSARTEAYIDDFTKAFPHSTVGYSTRASRLVQQRRLDMANNVLEQEMKYADKKDEAYNDFAKTVYQAVIYQADTAYTKWSLDKALGLAEQAYKANPLPIYRHLQAQIVYAKGDYAKALDLFTELQGTELGKNGEVYYEAAQCKTQLKAPQADILALLDKAATVQKGSVAAPYILARGRAYDNAGETRKAFVDYCTYDSLINNHGTYTFYYTKFKCEMKLHQYQLALNDIAHAIVLNRTEPVYYAEMASLQLRVNKLEDAIHTCDLALQLTQDNSDLFIIRGIALCESQHKAEGLDMLHKAEALGDTRAAALIKKYK